jgi:hypothetical protein
MFLILILRFPFLQIPFPPVKAIFVGIDVLLAVCISLTSFTSILFISRYNQAACGISKSYDALVDLFECVGNFLQRLQIYTRIPLTPTMTNIVVKILIEVFSVLALAMKQIKQGRCCKRIIAQAFPIAKYSVVKFVKKLLGESEIEAVLQRLDRLTLEEARMAGAQTLEVVHDLVNNVKVVMNGTFLRGLVVVH